MAALTPDGHDSLAGTVVVVVVAGTVVVVVVVGTGVVVVVVGTVVVVVVVVVVAVAGKRRAPVARGVDPTARTPIVAAATTATAITTIPNVRTISLRPRCTLRI